MSGLAYYDTEAAQADASQNQQTTPYAGIDTIGIWDIDGVPLDRLDASPETLGTNIQPRFSPDGTRLAYCKGPFPNQSIVVVPADNLNGTETMIAQGGTDFTTLKTYGYLDPDWSPDGTQIACIYAVYDTSLNLTANVVLIDSSGSGQIIQITNVPQNAAAGGVDFSPDGQWVAYTVMTSKSGLFNVLDFSLYNFTADIYIQNLATGEQIKITDDGASAEPAWAFAVVQPVIPDYTTTIPGDSNTTTVRGGDPDGNQCPFVVSLDRQSDILMLRQFRKILKEKDQFLVDLFYEHSAEAALILASNPELKSDLRALVMENIKPLRDLVKTGQAAISEDSVKRVTDFLKAVRTDAGPGLEDAIDTVLMDIGEGNFLQKLGIAVERSVNSFGG